jgi:hypothetical protein
MTKVSCGSWVEVESVVLTPSERAPQVPDDTRATPYVLRVSGFLASDAVLGEDVSITTLIGRNLKGKLITVNPSYTHSFGSTVEELLRIGTESENKS